MTYRNASRDFVDTVAGVVAEAVVADRAAGIYYQIVSYFQTEGVVVVVVEDSWVAELGHPFWEIHRICDNALLLLLCSEGICKKWRKLN